MLACHPLLGEDAFASIRTEVTLLRTGAWKNWLEADAARLRLARAGSDAVGPLLQAVPTDTGKACGAWIESALKSMAYEYRGKADDARYPGEALREAVSDAGLPLPARGLAADALGLLGDAKGTDCLVAAFDDEALAPRVARALGRLGATGAVSPLARCAETSTEAELLRAVAQSLGDIGTAGSVPALRKLAASEDASVSLAAAEALGAVSGEAALAALKDLAKSAKGPMLRRVNLSLLRHNVTAVREGGAAALSGEPGAACQGCHAQINADFSSSAHKKKLRMNCETCHGKSDAHMVEYGKVKPDKPVAKAGMPELCGACHEDFKSSRDVVYHPLVGLDHRFRWRRAPTAPKATAPKIPREEALKLVQNDELPEDMPVLFSDDFEDGAADAWETSPPSAWRFEKVGDTTAFLLAEGTRGGGPLPGMALLKDHLVSDFQLTARLKSTSPVDNRGRDLCLVFGYTSPASCYYVHLAAQNNTGYNMIALLAPGQKRQLIDLEEKPEPRLTDQEWHTVRLTRNAETGVIKVYVDDLTTPLLTAADKTHAAGQVGLGSLGDTGYFDDIELRGVPVKDESLERAKEVLSRMEGD